MRGVPRLDRMALHELQAALRHCGWQAGGNKAVCRTRLLDNLENIAVADNSEARTVVSIDVGYRNLAHCVMTRAHTVCSWGRVQLFDAHEPYSPGAYARAVHSYVQAFPLADKQRTMCLVELQQRRRGMGAILEVVFRVAIVEALLHAELSRAGFNPVAVSPARVASFCDELDIDAMRSGSTVVSSGVKRPRIKSKKSRAIGLIRALLEQSRITCTPEAESVWTHERKRDDLADCALQAYAWQTWQMRRRAYAQEFLNE